MSAAMAISGASNTPPAGLRLLTLRDFDFMRADLRPSRVDAAIRRASPQQTAAWRRLVAFAQAETTKLALKRRAVKVGVERGVWAEPDVAQDGADAWARDEGDANDEGDDDGDAPPPRFTD